MLLMNNRYLGIGVGVGGPEGVSVGVAVGTAVAVGLGVAVGTGVAVGVTVGVGLSVGVATGMGFAVGTSITADVGLAVGTAVSVAVGIGVGSGAAVGKDVSVGTGVVRRVEALTNLTTTVWLESILIFAILPSTPKTGPTHSSISQPDWGKTSMVTVRPWTNKPRPMGSGLKTNFAACSGSAITFSS